MSLKHFLDAPLAYADEMDPPGNWRTEAASGRGVADRVVYRGIVPLDYRSAAREPASKLIQFQPAHAPGYAKRCVGAEAGDPVVSSERGCLRVGARAKDGGFAG